MAAPYILEKLMRKLIAPVLLGIVAASAGMPAASAASHAQVSCRFNTVAQEDATGGQDTFTGAAYGFVASTTVGESVSIRCWVRVDGSEADSTAVSTGVTAAATSGQVTYTATDTQDVDLCADYTAGSESGTICVETTTTQIPPQPVIDAINQVFDIIAEATAGLDPILCGVIRDLDLPDQINPFYPITGLWIDPDDCDIWLINDLVLFVCPARLIDFVPYEDAYSGPGPFC